MIIENNTNNNNNNENNFNNNKLIMSNSNSNQQLKSSIQQQMTNGLFIRKEIQRFESVHPNIYTVYDLVDAISDFNLQQQIREHIVNIEDSFVNSQEWTLSRSVPDIKLGILGSIHSGKSALVHRFLTGTYMQEESPEGGRFKKEVVIDGQSYLLLIRDEGGPPEMQFSHWVDAVIFVFSLENEESLAVAHQYFLKMNHYRNMCDVPFILVGTQDYISEMNPRCIDDSRARSLASNEFKRCVYYETCATYGLHVERVFHEACQKVVNQRSQMLLQMAENQQNGRALAKQQSTSSLRLMTGQLVSTSPTLASPQSSHDIQFFQANSHLISSSALHTQQKLQANHTTSTTQFFQANPNVFKEPLSVQQQQQQQQPTCNDKRSKFLDFASVSGKNADEKLDIITPCSTPNQKRKDTNRRRSNLFTPNKKEDKNKLSDMGIGRSIPIKQGFLHKKTNSSLNKDWKKKYVTLSDNGCLKYYPSINDYMEDVHGKEIDLQKTTIKMPGANKPRVGRQTLATNDAAKIASDINAMNLNGEFQKLDTNGSESNGLLQSGIINGFENQLNYLARIDTNSKKRHRRVKSNHKADHHQSNKDDDQEGYEFIIVSLDNKQWHFEASSQEEREEWVQAVEQQILSSLQSNETNKLKNKLGCVAADNVAIQTMKSVAGNNVCADCDAPNPVWASLNHGALICIECSGIHRNLGTHLSRVRSLELDDWSNELINLMTSIGNRLINSIYEANCKPKQKPNMNSTRDEKEKWIRAKYELKQFVSPIQIKDISLGRQLIEAVSKQDLSMVIHLLSYCKSDDVNTCVSSTDKRSSLHIAASLSNTVLVQLLIWYGADVELADTQGKNALAYARASNSLECIQLLLYNNCPDQQIAQSLSQDLAKTTLSRRSQSSSSTSVAGQYEKLAFNVV